MTGPGEHLNDFYLALISRAEHLHYSAKDRPLIGLS